MLPTPDHLPPSDYASDLPSLDAERMDMLRELCLEAGQDMLREMLSSWESEAARHLAAARSAIAGADAESLKSAAHAIKGSCSNMGIVRLAELGRRLEHQTATPVIAAELLAQMETEFHRAQSLLADVAEQP